MISRIYDNPASIAAARASREWQEKREAKKAARRKKLDSKRAPKKIRIRPTDAFGRPEYRPGMGKEFYATRAWMDIRYRVLQARGAQCECCGATRHDGVRIHVDHIRPRHRFPQLELVESNLQILCEPCNQGKGARYETDWRTGAAITQPSIKATVG